MLADRDFIDGHLERAETAFGRQRATEATIAARSNESSSLIVAFAGISASLSMSKRFNPRANSSRQSHLQCQSPSRGLYPQLIHRAMFTNPTLAKRCGELRPLAAPIGFRNRLFNLRVHPDRVLAECASAALSGCVRTISNAAPQADYESSSRFSREYARAFGAFPRCDVTLQQVMRSQPPGRSRLGSAGLASRSSGCEVGCRCRSSRPSAPRPDAQEGLRDAPQPGLVHTAGGCHQKPVGRCLQRQRKVAR